ncbi:4788_t:CDS:2 [Diversispora eburnea]|uniref:4788_t:CDS:1 n=1 Tax=Diversispora eburnea TaxID=1213867 RepID=A0A9N9FD02_9GLOM|nr:4788_t:CDS:2 [Diversispora eburnea]
MASQANSHANKLLLLALSSIYLYQSNANSASALTPQKPIIVLVTKSPPQSKYIILSIVNTGPLPQRVWISLDRFSRTVVHYRTM